MPMFLQPKAKPKPLTGPPPNTVYLIGLAHQTGMPIIITSRSREVIYDSLGSLHSFILNRYGPQTLFVARPEHHW